MRKLVSAGLNNLTKVLSAVRGERQEAKWGCSEYAKTLHPEVQATEGTAGEGLVPAKEWHGAAVQREGG